MAIVEALREHRRSIRNLRSIGGVLLTPTFETSTGSRSLYARRRYSEITSVQIHNLSEESNVPLWSSLANYNQDAPVLTISPFDRVLVKKIKGLMLQHTNSHETAKLKDLVTSFDFRAAVTQSARLIGEEDRAAEKPISEDLRERVTESGQKATGGLKVNIGSDGRYIFQQQLIEAVMAPREQQIGDYPDRLDYLVNRSVTHLKVLLAREKAVAKLRKEFGEVADYISIQPDKLSRSPEGIFRLLEKDQNVPRIVPLNDIDTKAHSIGQNLDLDTLSFPLPNSPRELSIKQQAELVVNYLTQLTRRHSFDADLSEKFTKDNQEKVAQALQFGNPLQFSIFLELAKSTNPLNTSTLHPDIGELQIGIALAAFISSIETVTGKKPEIIIMNEFPSYQQTTRSPGAIYQSQFENILKELKIAEYISILPFETKTFNDFLRRKGVSEISAITFTTQTLRLLTDIYHAISSEHFTPGDLEDYIHGAVRKVSTGPIPHDDYVKTIAEYCTRNFHVMKAEYKQAVRTDYQGYIDLSLLYPEMSQSLLGAALKRQNASRKGQADDSSIAGKLRRQMREQAKLQSISFKALMRMRYIFRKFFDETITSSEYIPLSITNAKDKWSFPLGRTKNSKVYVSHEQQTGVNAQNGVGVLVDGQIVSLPYITIVENLELFDPINIHLGDITLQGYLYKPPH